MFSLAGGRFDPGFANGTDSAPGGVALVGERSPELANLPRGSQVVPNDKLGKGGAIHIDASDNLTISNGSGASPESVAHLKSAFEQDRRDRANQIVQADAPNKRGSYHDGIRN
jgi:hypothetical protein